MARRRRTTLENVLERPALNGGWDRLARQQDEQCEELKAQTERLERLEERFDQVAGWVKWFMRGVGVVAVPVLGRLVYDWISHVQIVLH